MKKRVLLINAYIKTKNTVSTNMIRSNIEEPYPSLALLYLAANLRKHDFEVRILDLPSQIKSARRNLKIEDDEGAVDEFVRNIVEQQISDFAPDGVGINCLFSGRFEGLLYISEIVKNRHPSMPVIIGGIHPTIFHTEILQRFSNLDFVIIGEGEESLVELLQFLFHSKGSLEAIDGICYREQGQILATNKSKFVSDLGEIPMPAWDLLNIEDYRLDEDIADKFWLNPLHLERKYRLPILTSRSCPMHCNFCSMHLVHGKQIRYRPVRDCAEEIFYLHDKYGANFFSIMDDNFTLNKKRVLELADLIVARNIRINMDTPNGISVKFFDADIYQALKAMGLVQINFAIESGSERMRNAIMGKKLTYEQIQRVFEIVKSDESVYVKASFIVGMPEETVESLEESFTLMKELAIDDVGVQYAIPFPGTRLYDQVARDNLLIVPETDVVLHHNFHPAADSPFIKPYDLSLDDLVRYKRMMQSHFADRNAKYGTGSRQPVHHLL